ncbi:MAG TPA: hypothetical protein VJO16_15675 [Candidatus Acidoferrum sp.]|nr:hypothetical protein [Candidatus Acidoferrum sp.]
MPNVLVYKARTLKPQTRAAIEAELGRSLKDDEDVSIMAFGTQDAATGGAGSRAGQKVGADFKKLGKKTARASDEDAEAAV